MGGAGDRGGATVSWGFVSVRVSVSEGARAALVAGWGAAFGGIVNVNDCACARGSSNGAR